MKYFIILLSLITYTGFAQTNNCSKFKTGTFTYANTGEQNTIITRNDSIQTEVNKKTGVKFTGSIKWLSDCKYTLTYTSVSNSDYNSIIGTAFNINIISTTENTYKYLAYDGKRKMDGEILKIE